MDVSFITANFSWLGALSFPCIVISVLLFGKAVLEKRSFSKKLPPGPWGLPVVGNKIRVFEAFKDFIYFNLLLNELFCEYIFFFYFDFLSSLSLSFFFLFFTPCFGIFIPRIIFLLVRALLNSVISRHR